MLVALVGIGTVVVVVLGVALLLRFARRNALEEAPPPSQRADFVAPVSSGQYRFRAPDESPEQFKARVDAENEEIASSKRGADLAPELATQGSNEGGGTSG
jgi:hypothetical protein